MEDNFGERLSYIMSLRSMRQKELAKAVDVTEATVSRYVNNKRSPDIDFIRAVVTVLDVSSDYLLGFSDNIFIDKKRPIEEERVADDARYVLVKRGGASVNIKDPEQVKLLDDFFLSLV